MLGQLVRQFTVVTLESGERRGAVVLRSVRQIMSGCKNYLTITGEGELAQVCTELSSTH